MSSELKRRRMEEYEMQLFGFNSSAVAATVKRIVKEKIQICCKKLSQSLEKTYHSNETDSSTSVNYEQALIKLYYSFIQLHLQNMKNSVQNVLSIPDNVLLNEDVQQRKNYSQEEVESAAEHLKSLQLRAKQAIVFQKALEEELLLLKDLRLHEDGLEIVPHLLEHNMLNIDNCDNILECIRNSKTMEMILRRSSSGISTEDFIEPDKFTIKKLDLNIFSHD